MLSKKNTQLGRVKILNLVLFILILQPISSLEPSDKINKGYVEIKILDKVYSQNSTLKLEIGKEKKYKNLIIKALKCQNSKFDDEPEITAYLQVKDITIKNKDKVFVFNDWTFASSPTIKPFDHPVYDIWLSKCII